MKARFVKTASPMLLILFTLFTLLFTGYALGCASANPLTYPTPAYSHQPDRVIVASGSLAHIWLLAGGELLGTTRDAFDNGFVPENSAVNIGGLHEPNLEYILALEPDLVILSSNLAGHRRMYEPLSAAGINVIYHAVDDFYDYLRVLEFMTSITGRADLFEQHGYTVQARTQYFRGLAAYASFYPTVLLLRASSTTVEARNSDTMAGIMLRNMNAINIADSEYSLLDNLSMEVIITKDPDFIFAITMGASEEDAMMALEEALLSNPAWSSLSAVQNGRYFMLPRELFHLQPNNRWAEAYQMLWEILYEN